MGANAMGLAPGMGLRLSNCLDFHLATLPAPAKDGKNTTWKALIGRLAKPYNTKSVEHLIRLAIMDVWQ
jgi:hypothetical protein